MHILRVGFLLGIRQIQRANIWTTILIVLVMTLTFLNLVAVSGILVGLITGAERAVQQKLIGDVLLTSLDDEDVILESELIINTLNSHPRVLNTAPRIDSNGTIEANYTTRRNLRSDRDLVSTRVTGIDVINEDKVSKLSENVIEGSYLSPEEEGYILVGSILIERYTEDFPDIVNSLTDVFPGDKVRVTINGATREFTVKGIVDAKVGELTSSIFLPERELRRLQRDTERNVDRISVRTKNKEDAVFLQEQLTGLGFGAYAKIQTFDQALPKFIQDIKNTFNILGTFIGAVGIIVASITIFIIIFINALSRRRQIGILKGIGIDRKAIEIAYVMQAAFYVIIGAGLGALITFGFLVGYFDRNPIDFPFSDGILVAEPLETFYRFIILFCITLLAGFMPAWLIVKQNTLNSILGRK